MTVYVSGTLSVQLPVCSIQLLTMSSNSCCLLNRQPISAMPAGASKVALLDTCYLLKRQQISAMPAGASKVALLDTKPNESSVDLPENSADASPTSLAFVYGTLKRGFGNHWLMEELINKQHARLVGTAQTKMKYPLVCGPFQVPFLLRIPGEGEHVLGELYQVDSHCMELLDELEGVTKRHYERCEITLTGIELVPSFKFSLQNGINGFSATQGHALMDCLVQPGEVKAQAYFAHAHYTPGLYQAPHLKAYTEKEAATYTRRIHRPQNRTFLEHIYHWIDEQKKEATEPEATSWSSI